ncbi:MAG TPA: alpha/beta hydrolase fold domain-containing protein, partial [Rhizomicrobium sp.]|nr:alpha/beta hydrolase fold domain-containing protein [Rhizomicrobium sp.]
YCPDADPTHPLVSPYRGDVTGLPPTLFHCSRDELLRDDSIRMAEKMKAAGVDATIEVWPGVFHVWQVTADVLPEARKAVANIVDFLKARLGQ